MAVKKFEDLFVWQEGRKLVKLVYGASEKWRDFGLRDQIRRAAVSIISNIAEGFERGTKDEFLSFLYIARGSCGEVRAQLYVAVDCGHISQDSFEKLCDKADHVGRLLYRLIEGYKKGSYGGQRYGGWGEKKDAEFEEYLGRIARGEKVTQ